MKEFIEILKERGIIDYLKLVRAFATYDYVEMEMNRDYNLRIVFDKACYKLGRKALIEELENILEGK